MSQEFDQEQVHRPKTKFLLYVDDSTRKIKILLQESS